ncbi:MAG: ferric reductase-like transmembrane domain-containing protein, partial [Actinomycetota bacterium]|nr:ferric reductase-like transmembrane domain-containing protein [Actinomycetota bacterium]
MTTLQQPRVGTVAARSTRSAIDPRVVLAAIAFGGLAVLGLWWQDTNFVYGWGSWLTNAGRLTGLLAGWTVLVLIALMARVPALERGVGADRLANWHSSGGRYVVFLAVAHTLLIIWGYAVTAGTGVLGETSTIVLTYPDVLMATVALGLFVLIGVVSARAARRRMSYETWHLVHLYTYIAIGLTFAHQFAIGADFTDPMVRWAWGGAYLVVGIALVWFRIVTPIRAAIRHRLRVAAVIYESRDVVSVHVTGRDLELLRAEAGQFFKWRFLTRGLWWAANPYSLSAAPTPGGFRITVKTAGTHSAALARLRPGTPVLAEGPYGAFTGARRTRRKVLLIGVGVGITPIRALFETVPAGTSDLTLLYRARGVDDLVLR